MPTPFEDGETSARAGQSPSQNPFPEGSSQHAEWTAGFQAAAAGGSDELEEDFDIGAKD